MEIQLFLRWVSSAVLGYIRDAPLVQNKYFAREVAEGLNLLEFTDSVRQRLGVDDFSADKVKVCLEKLASLGEATAEAQLRFATLELTVDGVMEKLNGA